MGTSLDVAGSSTGLRLALLVAAVITAAGLPMAFLARRRSASASTKSR